MAGCIWGGADVQGLTGRAVAVAGAVSHAPVVRSLRHLVLGQQSLDAALDEQESLLNTVLWYALRQRHLRHVGSWSVSLMVSLQ